MTADPTFDRLIAGPLAAVVGETLLAVDYWVLACDEPTFQPANPNASGLMAVNLIFKMATVEVTWGWDKALRTGWQAYHVQATFHADHVRGDTWSVQDAQGLSRFAAPDARPWESVVGLPLIGVEVYGPLNGPQAIGLSSPQGGVVLAVGESGENPVVGDNDEMLVFGTPQWRELRPADWSTLWSTSAVARQELALR